MKPESKTFEFAEFTFETGGNVLLRNGALVPLEPSAARVLRFFLENDGRLILKDEILETVWRDVFTTEDVLKRAVSQIRRALGDDARNARFIETFHRRGYRFNTRKDQISNGETAALFNGAPPPTREKSATGDPHFDCFIGRARELELLQAEFRRVLHGAGQPVLIAGDAGIGKTQTAARFTDWAQTAENAAVARVRFFDYEASFLPPYNVFLGLLGEACAAVFGAENDGKDLRQTVETRLKITLPDELFSDTPDASRAAADASRAIAPLAECFARLSRVRPLILIFDDVQWADGTSQKIIGYLMRISTDAPLMIVGLTRRGEMEDARSNLAVWLQNQAVYRSFTTLELAPLAQENCRALIAEIFGGQFDADEIADGDLAKLHTATGGNPYFLVETLRLLMNENVIEKSVAASGETRWHWRGLEDVPLPETVRMAARAKLSALDAKTREMVECAAVLGDTFQIKTLELMIAGDDAAAADEIIETSLDETIAAQILTEQNVAGADDCQFYHTTLRRAVYMDLSPRRRKRLHARAMRAIEISHRRDLERFAAALAAHAAEAGEYEKSLELNLRAARAAAARFDWLEAAELVARARRVAEKGALAETTDFLAICGEVYMSVGRRAEAEKILARAAAQTESADVLHNLGRTRILLGKYREAIAPLEKSLRLAHKSGDNFIASAALIQLASAKYALCDYEASCEILQKIVDEEDAQSYNRAVALGKLGWTRALQSRYREAKKLLTAALDFHRTAGDMRERAVLSMCLNWCEHGAGNYEAAIEYARAARREAQIVGEPYNESVALMRIAKARIAQGFAAEAERDLRETWKKQKDLDAPHAQAETVWMRGRARLAQGKTSEAAEDFKTALAMIQTVGDRDDEFRILIDQAALEDALGMHTQALNLAEQAAEIAAEIGVDEGVGESLIEKSAALLKLAKGDEAVAAAREAVRLLEESESGERWRAHYALARALQKSNKNSREISTEVENSLRRAVEILDWMRAQFAAEEERRYVEFTAARNAPARDLYALLKTANRRAEADEIRRQWLIE